MTDPYERFWHDLQCRLAAEELAEHAAAEQALAQQDGGAEAMPAERIEAIVAAVTAPGAAPPAVTAAKPRRWVRTFAIAAAISLVPGLLIATALNRTAGTQLMLRNTNETLDYREAIDTLVKDDVDVDPNSRNTCQLLIMDYLLWSARTLKRVLLEEPGDPVLQAATSEALHRCRQVLVQDLPFTHVGLAEPMAGLIERVQDRNLPSALRTAAVVQLGVMMEQGAAALLQGGRMCAEDIFSQGYAVAKRKLLDVLQ